MKISFRLQSRQEGKLKEGKDTSVEVKKTNPEGVREERRRHYAGINPIKCWKQGN